MSEHDISFRDSKFVSLGGYHVSQINTMPVLHIKGDNVRALGTCFGITNDGLCLTARHVIDEVVNTSMQQENERALTSDEGYFGALYASDEIDPETGHYVGGILPMNKVFVNANLDIALIHLNLPVDTRTGERLRFPVLSVKPQVPMVGQTVVGMGYHLMSWKKRNELEAQIFQTYSATKGIVEEVHFPKRDQFLLHFPCFRTSVRFDGGMSGGPVFIFDETAEGAPLAVGGVVCSSLGADGEGKHTSYVSMIGPAFGIALEATDPSGLVGKHFLWDFVEGGAVVADLTEFSCLRLPDRLALNFGEDRTLVFGF